MNFKISKIQLLGLSVLSGLMMGVAWPVSGAGLLALIAFVPLLFVENYIHNNKSFFSRGAAVLYAFPAFLVWNVMATWWIWNASPIAIVVFVLNGFFMTLVFGLFHIVRRKLFNSDFAYLTLILFWISFEYLLHDWDLAWPWLNLGGVFASNASIVQWYEFTGVFGGAFWVWLSNIMVFRFVNYSLKKRKIALWPAISLSVVVALPILLSLWIYNHYEEKGTEVEVIAVQPNMDPWGEQFSNASSYTVGVVLDLVRKEVSDETNVVICPESTLQGRIWESRMHQSEPVDSIKSFLKDYPNLSVIIGASTSRMLDENEEVKPAARRYWVDTTKMYYNYNTAMFFEKDKETKLYHKSKLVAGAEIMPFKKVLKFIDRFALDLGGTSGTLGVDEERGVFQSSTSEFAYAPVICYESTFGGFVSDYISNGANLITVITNDGWWGDTPGYKQHFELSRLRAIENRTSVARSANTGISGFINQRGDVVKHTDYWVRDVIKAKVFANPEPSFYTQNKNYLSNISLFFSALLLLAFTSLSLRSKNF